MLKKLLVICTLATIGTSIAAIKRPQRILYPGPSTAQVIPPVDEGDSSVVNEPEEVVVKPVEPSELPAYEGKGYTLHRSGATPNELVMLIDIDAILLWMTQNHPLIKNQFVHEITLAKGDRLNWDKDKYLFRK